ncbi:MAG TPA: DNA polymerase III subunit beta [Solirubrobacterales bacterium]|jgi:DNA polymerase-3 subunit beta|nr:DNA polymerase III subunit beta [Solirubrobacterales bacterium]
MKISVPQDALVSQLQVAGRAVSTRSAVPSLGGILVDVDGDGMTLRATDMEVGLVLRVDGEVEAPGSALLPGRLLVDIARNLPGGKVSLALRPEERDVELTAGTARFHLRTLPPEDFPRLPEFEGEPITLPGKALSDTIERVARAASRDEVRPILTGVLMTAEESTLTMVATDSYRLSVKHTELERPVSQSLEANVPARALRELSRIVGSESIEEIELALLTNQVVFRAAGIVLSSRLIEGQFPSHRQLIPETFEHEVRLPRGELLEVTRRIGQLAQRNAPLRLAFAEGEVTISAETPEVGDASEAMPAPFSGEPLEIAFNPEFLIAGIESIDSEELVLRLTSPLRPGLLQPVDRDDFSYLVMPIRLNV